MIRALQRLRRQLAGTTIEKALMAVGVGRFVRARYDAAVLRRGFHETVICGCRLKFVVSSSAEITQIDMHTQSEEDFVERLLAAIRPGDVVYDVGANLGVTSMVLSKRIPGDLRILAFEPHPGNAAHLRSNLRLNNVENVEVHEVAVGRERGEAVLYDTEHLGVGTHSLIRRGEGVGHGIRVPVASIASLVAVGHPAPNVMKVDVEGAERYVAEGLSDARGVEQLRDTFIEIHPDQLERAGSSDREVCDLMARAGFREVWSSTRCGQRHVHFSREVAARSGA